MKDDDHTTTALVTVAIILTLILLGTVLHGDPELRSFFDTEDLAE